LHVCKSQKDDGIYYLTTIKIAKSTKERSPDLFYKDEKTSKLNLHFQLIENIIVLYKDENQSSQHLYK
jgi:hypothetical protein